MAMPEYLEGSVKGGKKLKKAYSQRNKHVSKLKRLMKQEEEHVRKKITPKRHLNKRTEKK